MVHQIPMKRVYLALCILGVLIPFTQFVPWLLQQGPDLGLFIDQMFANPIASFFSLDLIVSAVAVSAASWASHTRGRPHMWLPVVGTLCVGVSLGLPLWLYLNHSDPDG